MSSYSSLIAFTAILGSFILSAHGFISPQRNAAKVKFLKSSSTSLSATRLPQNATKLYYQSPEESSSVAYTTISEKSINGLQLELERRRLLATVPLFHNLNEGDIARLSVLATPGKYLPTMKQWNKQHKQEHHLS